MVLHNAVFERRSVTEWVERHATHPSTRTFFLFATSLFQAVGLTVERETVFVLVRVVWIWTVQRDSKTTDLSRKKIFSISGAVAAVEDIYVCTEMVFLCHAYASLFGYREVVTSG